MSVALLFCRLHRLGSTSSSRMQSADATSRLAVRSNCHRVDPRTQQKPRSSLGISRTYRASTDYACADVAAGKGLYAELALELRRRYKLGTLGGPQVGDVTLCC